MPQMAPLNWLILFIYFIFIYFLFNSSNYFIFNIKNTSSLSILPKKKITWKW